MLRNFYTPKGNYRIDIHSEGVDHNGKEYFAAIVYAKERNYWNPVLQGIYLTKEELYQYTLMDT